MKNILVFGGYGFLGFYLVNELVNRGYKVTIADIFKDERLSSVNYIKCDIINRNDVENVFKQQQFDIVYNLAGFANLDNAIKEPPELRSMGVPESPGRRRQ